MLRVVAHQPPVGLGIEVPVTAHKGIILHIELSPGTFNKLFLCIVLFQIEKVTQTVPNLDHGGQPLPRSVIFDG